jgi:hypothetical protein
MRMSEGRFVLEREAARGIVELEGGDSEIGQHAVHDGKSRFAAIAHDLRWSPTTPTNRSPNRASRRSANATAARIPVDPETLPCSERPLQQRFGVPARPSVASTIRRAGSGSQQRAGSPAGAR